ncbi:MAG: hypothetical protein ABIX00_05715 [Polaromonas sp.]
MQLYPAAAGPVNDFGTGDAPGLAPSRVPSCGSAGPPGLVDDPLGKTGSQNLACMQHGGGRLGIGDCVNRVPRRPGWGRLGGGIGTLLVAVLWLKGFPALADRDRMSDSSALPRDQCA